MKSQVALYLFCGLGLFWGLSQSSPWKGHKRKDPTLPKARAYVFGEKHLLTSQEKKAHKKLHVIHLLTPSGMHLTALLFAPGLLLRRKKWPLLTLLGLVYMASVLWGAPPSFKRMCLVLGLARFSSEFSFRIVVGGFALDALMGGFVQSPLSWFMSFLFMGTLSLQCYEKKRSLYMGLLGGVGLVGLVFGGPVYPLGMLIGWIVVAVFPWLFALLVGEALLFPIIPTSNLFISLIETLAMFSGPSLPAWMALLLALLYFCRLPLLLWSLLALTPLSLPNLPKHRQKAVPFPTPPPRNFEHRKVYAWGVQLTYTNGMICRNRLYEGGWSTRCRK